ncbi:MAG: NUDIX hydrolase [Candidatus Heimdallarchaeota archaeon]|nr:MAG: NUDIX hydrolase [Candidatus Heimdallarchaeota archaeon]
MVHASDGLLIDQEGRIVLIQRRSETYLGFWAIPGGMVEKEETIEEALVREMKEEVGVEVKPRKILGVFSDPDRDPRGRVISTVFICDYEGELKAGSDAGAIKLCTVEEALTLNLAFDHHFIIRCYQNWIEKKGSYWSNKSI